MSRIVCGRMGNSLGSLPLTHDDRHAAEEQRWLRGTRLDALLSSEGAASASAGIEETSQRIETSASAALLQLLRSSGAESAMYSPGESVTANFSFASAGINLTAGSSVAYLAVVNGPVRISPGERSRHASAFVGTQAAETSRDFPETEGRWSFHAPFEPGQYVVRLYVAPRGRSGQEVIEVASRTLRVGVHAEVSPLQLGEAIQCKEGGVWTEIDPEECAVLAEALRRGEPEVNYLVNGALVCANLEQMTRSCHGKCQALRRRPAAEAEIMSWLRRQPPSEPLGSAKGLAASQHWKLSLPLRQRREALIRAHRALETQALGDMEEVVEDEGDEDSEVSAAAVFTRGILGVLLEPALSGKSAAVATQILSNELSRLKPFSVTALHSSSEESAANAAVCEAAAAMASVCHRLLRQGDGSWDMAALLFRLALLRGCVEDALTVSLWLLEQDEQAGSTSQPSTAPNVLWPMVKDLHSVHGPGEVEDLVNGMWRSTRNPGQGPVVRRAMPSISPEALKHAGEGGVVINVKIEGVANDVLIGITARGSQANLGADASTIAIGQGMCRSSIDDSTSKCETAFGRAFRAGDIVSIKVTSKTICVSIGEEEWGEAPHVPNALIEDGVQIEADIPSGAAVQFDLFPMPLPEGTTSWGEAAGQQTFAWLEKEARVEAASEPGALAGALLWCLGRNAALSGAVAELESVVVESKHQYLPNTNVCRCIRIPGASRLRIEFDTRSETEDQNDWLQFARDEAQTQLVGPNNGRFTGKGPWLPFDMEGDTVWYWFRSDAADERWGYKFKVTPVISAMASPLRPLSVEPTTVVLDLLEQLLRRAQRTPNLSPLALDGIFALVPAHLVRTSRAPAALKAFESVSTAFMQLAERPPTPATERLAVTVLHKAGDLLFRSAEARVRAMIDLHRAGRSPAVAEALGSKLESAAASFAPLLDVPEDARRLLGELLDLAVADARQMQEKGQQSSNAGGARAARQLLRVWRDVFSRFVKEAVPVPSHWQVIVELLASALRAAAELVGKPPEGKSFLDIVCVPMLHAAAMAPWYQAPTTEVSNLLPQLIAVPRIVAKVSAPIPAAALDASAASLVLIAALCRLRSTGGVFQEVESPFMSTFVHVVPQNLLQQHLEVPARPAEVDSVLQAMHMRLEVADAGLSQPPIILTEVVTAETQRAITFEAALRAQQQGVDVANPRIRRLAFALLVHRHRHLDALETALQSGTPDTVLLTFWVHAGKLASHARSLAQGLSANGESDPTVLFEERLQFALQCTSTVEATPLGTRREMMEALMLRREQSATSSTEEEHIQPSEASRLRSSEFSAMQLKMKIMSSRHSSGSARETSCLGGEPGDMEQLQILLEKPLDQLCQEVVKGSECMWHAAVWLGFLAEATESARIAPTWALAEMIDALGGMWRTATVVSAWSADTVAIAALRSAQKRAAAVLSEFVKPISLPGWDSVSKDNIRALALASLCGYWGDYEMQLMSTCIEEARTLLPWVSSSEKSTPSRTEADTTAEEGAAANESMEASSDESKALRLGAWLLHLTVLGALRRLPAREASSYIESVLHTLMRDTPDSAVAMQQAAIVDSLAGGSAHASENEDSAEAETDDMAIWEHDRNPGRQHFDLNPKGNIATYRRGAPDYCNVLARAPITKGTHFFEFVMHKIGDEQWTGLTDDAQMAGTRNSLRAHRSCYTYYCGRRRKTGTLQDGLASLHVAGTVDQRCEHVGDNDVIGLLVDCDNHRAIFILNGVVQGECAVPAKPLWPITHLDATGDRTEIRKKPVTKEFKELIGRQAPHWLQRLDLPLLQIFGLGMPDTANTKGRRFDADAGGFMFCATVPTISWLRTLGAVCQITDAGPLAHELRGALAPMVCSECPLTATLACRILHALPGNEEMARLLLQAAGSEGAHPVVVGEAADVLRLWLASPESDAVNGALLSALGSEQRLREKAARCVIGEPPTLRCLGPVMQGNRRSILLSIGGGIRPAVIVNAAEDGLLQVPLTAIEPLAQGVEAAQLLPTVIDAVVDTVAQRPAGDLYALRAVLVQSVAAESAVRMGILSQLLPQALEDSPSPDHKHWADLRETCHEDFCALLQLSVQNPTDSETGEGDASGPDSSANAVAPGPSLSHAALVLPSDDAVCAVRQLGGPEITARPTLEVLLNAADAILNHLPANSVQRLFKAARGIGVKEADKKPALLEELPEETAELSALEAVLRLTPLKVVPGCRVMSREDVVKIAHAAAKWGRQQLALGICAQVAEGWLRVHDDMGPLGGADELAKLCSTLVKAHRLEVKQGLQNAVLQALARSPEMRLTFERWSLAHLLGTLSAGQRQLVEESPHEGCSESVKKRLGIVGASTLTVELDHRCHLRGRVVRILKDNNGEISETELGQWTGNPPWPALTVSGEAFWMKFDPGSEGTGCYRVVVSGDVRLAPGVSPDAGLWMLRAIMDMPGGDLPPRPELAAVLVGLAETRTGTERLQALEALDKMAVAPHAEDLDWGAVRDAVEALVVRAHEVGQCSVSQAAARFLLTCGGQPREAVPGDHRFVSGEQGYSVSTDGRSILCIGDSVLCPLDGELELGQVESLAVAGGHETVALGVVPADRPLPGSLGSPGMYMLQLSGRLMADGAVTEVSPAHGRRAVDVAEDVTLSCEVSASSNADRCRRALQGIEHYWESRGDTPSPANPHWLQLTLPAGLELRRLIVFCRKFDSYSPKTVRVRVGSVPEPQAMATVAEADLDDREYRVTVVDEAQLHELEDSPRLVRFEVIENRGINCKIAGLQIFAGQSGFRGACTVTATCNLSANAPRLSFDAGKGSRSSVPLPLHVKRWRFLVGAQSRGATARILRRPGNSLTKRFFHAEAVLRAFAEKGSQMKPSHLPGAFAHDLFAEWWVLPGGGADDEREASKPRPWLKAEAGELCSFGAGVSGCNGIFRPVENDDAGHVVLYMNDQGAIMFWVEEGWRMNSEFNVSEFDYSTGADPMGPWLPQVPSKGPQPTVCDSKGPPPPDKSTKKVEEKPPEDAWAMLAPKLNSSVTVEPGEKCQATHLCIEGAESISIRISAEAPCGYAVSVSADEAGLRPVGVLSSPDESLELPMAECYVQGIVSRPPVWTLEERSGVAQVTMWDVEGNPGRQHLAIDGGGCVVSFKRGAPDFCSVVTKSPVESGVHYFEFVTHKIGDELWVGLVDDPQLAGVRTNLRVHRSAYTYYCGRRRGSSNSLKDGQASLQGGGKAEQKFDSIADGDVIGLLINADRHRAMFFKGDVVQGECVVPAKPLWLVVQLDAQDDRVELRKVPVTPDLEELIGAVPSADCTHRAEASLHDMLLVSHPKDSEVLMERFTVQGLFHKVQAALPQGTRAYASPATRILDLNTFNPEGVVQVGIDLAHSNATLLHNAPWLWGGQPLENTEGDSEKTTPRVKQGNVVEHLVQEPPLQAGDLVSAVAIVVDGGKLASLVLTRNGAVAAWWDFGAEGPQINASMLRLCMRAKGASTQMRLEEACSCEAPAEFAASGLTKEMWNEILRVQRDVPEHPSFTATVQPKTLLPQGKKRLVEEHLADAWAEFKRLGFEGWTLEDDEALVRLVQRAGDSGSGRSLNLAQLRGVLGEGGTLGTHDAQSTHVRYSLLCGLNLLVTNEILPFIDVRSMRAAPHSRLVLACRPYLLPELRDGSFRETVDRTSSTGEELLNLDRTVAMQCRDAGRCDAAGEVTIFGQAAKQASRWQSKIFRSQGFPFRVRYRDEPGQDSGGLFRDFLDTVADELMSEQLPVLIPTPNQLEDTGENRETFLLNAALDISPNSPGCRMLHFLGRLMGVCLRRGDVLPLCLSQVVWKGLLEEDLGLEDLESFDCAAANGVRQLSNLATVGIDAVAFQSSFSELRFVTKDSADQERELVEHGRNTCVSFEDAPRFARLMLDMRLNEASAQLHHLRTGLRTVIPLECMVLWTWQQFEERVCGIAAVDVDLLRKYARYEDISPEAPEVGHLWATLHELSQKDLRLFLHFVWGRSRLPADGSPKWAEGFKIVSQSSSGDPDQSLPTAHTCFFQLDLPAYTSQEICKQRILFAIQNCVALGIA